MIAIYTLTSALHDEAAVNAATGEFLGAIGMEFEMKGADFQDYGTTGGLDLIYVRTGGTEGVFKPLLPDILKSRQPVFLLTSGKSNSLAASMEILSYLRQKGVRGEIIHGSPEEIRRRVAFLEKVETARKKLSGLRLAVLGKPSDWLIASEADCQAAMDRFGIEIGEIPMNKVITAIEETPEDELGGRILCGESLFDAPQKVKDAVPGAYRIYVALRKIISDYNLDGFTIRCFDLLDKIGNTACLALAKFNADGVIAGCEGDVPAMISMAIANAVTGVSGLQANPSKVDTSTGEVLFAHCTIPLNMVTRFGLDTHFESGKGVGIRGHFQEGPVTVLKVSGDLKRHFVGEGMLIRNQSKPDLCRTQVVLHLENTEYFLTDPIGNHHIIMPGHCKDILESLLA